MTNKLEQIAQDTWKEMHGFDAIQMREMCVKYLERCLAKLAEGVEPEMYRYKHDDDKDWRIAEPRNAYMNTVEDTINEIQEYIDRGYKYQIQKLYTAEALAAVQQQTAEACAKLAGVCGLGKEAAAAIRSNAWREYL